MQNKKTASNLELNPPVNLNPSMLCQYDTTMQRFSDFNQLERKCTRNSSVHWHEPWKGVSLFSEAGWGGGSSRAPTTNQQRWGLATGSVCYETTFCPFQSEVFLSTSPVGRKLPDMVTKHLLFIIVKEEANCHRRKTKVGPKNVIILTSPVLPDGASLEVLQKPFSFWNTIFSTELSLFFSYQAWICQCVCIRILGKHVLPLSY